MISRLPLFFDLSIFGAKKRKKRKNANLRKVTLPVYFLILDNFYFMKNLSKMPLSTLKI